MKLNEGEYLFIFNSNMHSDKTARAYALSIDHVKINERDIHKDRLTPTQLVEVAKFLDIPIKDLCRPSTSSSHEQYADEELVNILSHDPTKMLTPIILSPNNSFIVGSSYELIKEQLGPTTNESK